MINRQNVPSSNCSAVQMALWLELTPGNNDTQLVVNLLKNFTFGQYQVTPLATIPITFASILGINCTNQNPLNIDQLPLHIASYMITSGTAGGLNLDPTQVIPYMLPAWYVANVTSSPPPLPPPPTSSPSCASPRLGSLCGLDAIGAIIGIALGGLAFLALLAALLAWCLRGKVGLTSTLLWASSYSNIYSPSFRAPRLLCSMTSLGQKSTRTSCRST